MHCPMVANRKTQWSITPDNFVSFPERDLEGGLRKGGRVLLLQDCLLPNRKWATRVPVRRERPEPVERELRVVRHGEQSGQDQEDPDVRLQSSQRGLDHGRNDGLLEAGRVSRWGNDGRRCVQDLGLAVALLRRRFARIDGTFCFWHAQRLHEDLETQVEDRSSNVLEDCRLVGRHRRAGQNHEEARNKWIRFEERDTCCWRNQKQLLKLQKKNVWCYPDDHWTLQGNEVIAAKFISSGFVKLNISKTAAEVIRHLMMLVLLGAGRQFFTMPLETGKWQCRRLLGLTRCTLSIPPFNASNLSNWKSHSIFVSRTLKQVKFRVRMLRNHVKVAQRNRRLKIVETFAHECLWWLETKFSNCDSVKLYCKIILWMRSAADQIFAILCCFTYVDCRV